MIAPKAMPEEFREWNARHGAPFGRSIPTSIQKVLTRRMIERYRGPFSFQENNTTRAFEYPWAFHALPLEPGLRVLEIGGGLSGFQFVLDRAGCQVENIDPGMDAKGVGWPCTPESMEQLNELLGTSVRLHNTTVDAVELEPASFDRAYSISVIEHLPQEDVENAVRTVHDVLVPGGSFVLTLDLFLNLTPFTSRAANEFGRNVSVEMLTGLADFEMVLGDREELFGFPEFDADRLQSRLESYLIGDYPALTQLVILRKPE